MDDGGAGRDADRPDGGVPRWLVAGVALALALGSLWWFGERLTGAEADRIARQGQLPAVGVLTPAPPALPGQGRIDPPVVDPGSGPGPVTGSPLPPGETGVAVPKVLGAPLNKAREILAEAGLAGTVGAGVPGEGDPAAADVVVVATTPEAGTLLPRGGRVRLAVVGPEAEFPDIVGMKWDDAQPLLQAAGFWNVRVEETNAERYAGTPPTSVVDAPRPGDRLRVVDEIRVVVYRPSG